jgi:hypothetical protein
MNRRTLWGIAVALGLAIAGCGGGSSKSSGNSGGDAGNVQQISVALSTAPPASLNTGATATIAATVVNDSANKGVTWSCAPASACGSFNPAQTASAAATTFTAPANAPQGGSVTITATSVSDPMKSASATVSITVPISVNFSVAPPASLQTGATAVIAAVVQPAPNVPGPAMTWSCAPANACGSFSSTQTGSGQPTSYTAPATVPQKGQVTITATSTQDPTKSVSATVSIGAPVSVSLSTPPPASLNIGATAPIAATVGNDSANAGVTWSCAPANTCGSFSPTQTASGASTTYTAPASMPSTGLVIITAISVTDTNKSASANIAIGTAGAISVVITTFSPNKSVQTGATSVFAATVANDSTNAGVTWSCSVATGDPCGSFNPTQTASGVTTTYTAPASVPQSNLVSITATSVADTTKFFSRQYVIYAAGTNNGMLKGQYAILMSGQVSSANLPIAASVTLDGNGNVTTGEFDQPGGAGPSSNLSAVPVTGTYAVGSDGRGTMTLSFSIDGVPGAFLPLSFALTSASHGVISETDGINSVSGSLDLQSAGPSFTASQISGGYSFTLTGEDLQANTADVQGGIVTASGTGNLTNGTLDTNDGGTFQSAAFQGTYTSPDAFGRGTIAVNNGTFVYYIVTPEVLRLVETDANVTASGSAFGQGTAASFTNAALSGNFAFNVLGQSTTGATAVVGQFTTNGNGTFTAGTADSVSGDGSTVSTLSMANSTYSFTGSPRGTASLAGGVATVNIYLTDPALNLLDPNNPVGGGGALLLETDANGYTVGQLLAQASPGSATLQGNYVINITALQNIGAGSDFELDLTGQAPASAGAGFSGLADYAGASFDSATNSPITAAPITGGTLQGTFNADSANPGHFTGQIIITPSATNNFTYFFPLAGTSAFLGTSYYQVSSTTVVFIQTDGQELAVGVLEQ